MKQTIKGDKYFSSSPTKSEQASPDTTCVTPRTSPDQAQDTL